MKSSLIFLVLALIFISACSTLSDKQIIKDPAKAIESCSNDPADKQEGCFSHIAELISNSSPDLAYDACSKIPKTEDPQNIPMHSCIKILIDSQNTSELKLNICKKIERDDWKKDCIEKTASSETDPNKAIQVCNEIAEDNNFKSHCYSLINNQGNISTDTQSSICDSRPDRDNCYDDLGRSLSSTNPQTAIEMCSKISNTEIKNNCLNQITNSKDLVESNPDLAITACSSVSSSNRCFADLAKTLFSTDSKQGVNICKKITDENEILNCYTSTWFTSKTLVVNNYDFTVNLCNYLKSKKDDCLNKMIPAFIDSNPLKAKEICKLMSSSASSECLNSVNR